jgi:hypothetical protein
MDKVKKNNLTKFVENMITNEFKNNTAERICLLARVNVAYKLGDYWAERLQSAFKVMWGYLINWTFLSPSWLL